MVNRRRCSTECVPHQRRPITFRPKGRMVCCLQQFLIKNDLNGFHLSTQITI